MDISKQKCLFSKSGLLACAKGCPPPATRGIFYSPPQKQDKTGEREKRVCVTAAGFCGCESSHFHTFLDEMRRGKEEAKEKKKKADWD